MRNIGKYEVFKLADEMVLRVYLLTGQFPRSEQFGLTSQMRRAAYSIPMNLVEGAARSSQRDFARFVNIAIGSCEEVRYQLSLAGRLGYAKPGEVAGLEAKYEEVKRMLTRLLQRVTAADE
ncbi:MAG: four helix bundle protein [bacterium]